MIKQTYLIICILLVGWLTGCQDYDETIDNPYVVDGNKIEVSIAATMPALTVQTKAEADSNEKQLTHVDVLVFEADGNDEIYSYRTQHSNDLESPGNSGEVEVKVKLELSKNDEKYRIVFIANMKEEVEDFFRGKEEQELTTYTKDELLKQITLTQQEAWPTGENFRALPMWGEASQTTKIDKTTTSGDFGSMKLLRSVARIELGVSINGSQQTDGSDFIEIRKVKVYNAREKGRAVPDRDHITNGKATAPSLLSGSGIIDKEDMTYELSTTGENKNILTGVYVNEAANRGENGEELSNALFLIVEAVYKKEDPTNNKATFYKIGFYDEDNKPTDILRNFTYNMTITGVSGPGEEEEEDAVGGTSGNLTVAMTDWSDGKMKHVVFNGQYYLAVSESSISVSKEAGTQSLFVKTNYPKGWEAKITEGGSWLKNLNPVSSSALEQEEQLSFSVEEFVIEENGGNNSREGTITLSCANQLELELKITQVAEEGVSLRIQIKNANGEYVDLDDNTLHFHSGNHREIDPYELKITWTPTDQDLVLDFDRTTFEWDPGSLQTMKTLHEGGTAYLTIQPARMLNDPVRSGDDPNTWFPYEETKLKVQVGGTDTKEIIKVEKQHYEVYIERSERYELDGKEHSFKLYSNTDWRTLYVVIDDVLTPFINPHPGKVTGSDNITGKGTLAGAGQVIEFDLGKPNDNVSINGEVTIKVLFIDFNKHSYGEVPTDTDATRKDVVRKDYIFRAYHEGGNAEYIAGGDANCYVLQPGGKSVHIPVTQANRSSILGEQIKSNTQLKLSFIWTDYNYNYNRGDDGPIVGLEFIDGVNTGSTAIIKATPGSKAGNVVIGVTDLNDNILWSWHLWVSEFDPNNVVEDRYVFRNYQFLDRNLGALTDTPGDPRSLGLYYQWGRKDPFPSAQAIGSSNFVTIYDSDGKVTAIKPEEKSQSPAWGSGVVFVDKATRNPLTFITNSETWFTADVLSYYKMSQFWSENETSEMENATKGVYDPCPDGWKTIPASLSSNSEWYKLFATTNYYSGGYSRVYQEESPSSPIPIGVDLGYWPHAGYISGNSGTITGTNVGRYWTGNKEGAEQSPMCIFSQFNQANGGHPAENFAGSNGLTIRCMRRTDNMRSGGGD